MKTATVAEAKSRFSAMLNDVESGEEIIITRRGRPVARIIQEQGERQFDFAELRRFVEAKPCNEGVSVESMRERDLL